MWDYAEKYLKRRMSYGNINALAKYLREKGKGKMEVFVKVMNTVNDIIWASGDVCVPDGCCSGLVHSTTSRHAGATDSKTWFTACSEEGRQ